jgi:UDP-N-acetylglucosamine diphosphorylase / glucose-1-phosphate thymidylyltransferase / UDP-N-acetylgalactosamine diphosphorylase / glucosamine-1-phosphate N-acetyltransferase / galactosamine-1-phosphate N-acetyltransferase
MLELRYPFKSKTTKNTTHDNAISILNNTTNLIAIDFFLLKSMFSSKRPILINSTVHGLENCFFGNNVKLKHCVIDASKGPVIIGDDVEVMEFSVIHGPAVIGARTSIKPHAYLRNNCIIGENCVVAGELKNTIILSNSNKGHSGYIGDSIVGEYCNIGAGTTTSNLKNNFSNIKVYSVSTKKFEISETQKLGCLMGDFSMTSINTLLQGGTVIGVHSHVFSSAVCPKYFPDFSWGKDHKYHPLKWRQTATNLLLHKHTSQADILGIMAKLEDIYNQNS